MSFPGGVSSPNLPPADNIDLSTTDATARR